MTLRWITLAIAVVLALTMAIAVGQQGWHSTGGIRTALLNFPGIILGAVVGQLVDNELVPIAIATALANWAIYFWVIKGILFLKRQLYPS